MTSLNLSFPVRGDQLPTDHGYHLYSSLSNLVPAFHAPDSFFRFASITGTYAGKGNLKIEPQSRFRCRVPSHLIADVMPLAGKELKVGGYSIKLGIPEVSCLIPAASLKAHLVTFKNSNDPDRFLTVAREKLKDLNIQGDPQLPLIESGPRAGEPRRKIIRISGKKVIGYPLLVLNLNAQDSLTLQENGLGGRTRIGCGFFMPMQKGR